VLNWVGQWAPGREPEAFEARLYDVLFRSEEPGDAEDWLGDLNAGNLEVVTDALATPGLAKAAVGDRCNATADAAVPRRMLQPVTTGCWSPCTKRVNRAISRHIVQSPYADFASRVSKSWANSVSLR